MLRPGQVIVLCVLALLCIGVVMVNSAGMSVRPDGTGAADSSALFWSLVKSRPVVYLLLALGALVTCSLLPIGGLTSRVQAQESPRPSDTLALAVGALILVGLIGMVYLPVMGREVNGSSRWIEIVLPGLGPQSIQPSEVAKWGLVILLAWYATRRGSQMRSVLGGLAPALGVAALVAGLVALEDLGTGVLIAGAASVVLVAGGARLWPFLALAPVGLAGIGGLILASPYRLERVRTFVDPYADPRGSGYHMIQSMAAIAGGEGPGRGLGHGLQKFGYLPEDRTDFVFSVICEELGMAGAGMVITLYIVLIWACITIVRHEQRRMPQLVGLGIATTLGLQATMNLAVVTGLAPTKGIALPLVSAGGTGWLLTSAALGLVVAMDRCRVREPLASEVRPSSVHAYDDVDEPEIVVTSPGVHAMR